MGFFTKSNEKTGIDQRFMIKTDSVQVIHSKKSHTFARRSLRVMKKGTRKRYRLGLALSGGGARGFAHIGVFKLLEECGVRPDVIVGTSAGALMGTLFAAGHAADEIKQMFTGREFSEFAQLQIPKAGLFDSSRFSRFVEQHLRVKTFEELQTPMMVVATDLDHGCSHTFSSGLIAEPIRASCSIPTKRIIFGRCWIMNWGRFAFRNRHSRI